MDVGTPVLGEGGNNPPSLRGVWEAAPYFSDGSARTLEEALRRTDPDARRRSRARQRRAPGGFFARRTGRPAGVFARALSGGALPARRPIPSRKLMLKVLTDGPLRPARTGGTCGMESQRKSL